MGVHEIVPIKKQTLTGGIEPVGRSAFADQNFKGTAPFIGAALIASIKQI